MRDRTHFLFSILFGSIFFDYFSFGTSYLIVAVFAISLLFGSIFPDIDTSSSSMSKKVGLIGSVIRLFTKHRGIFHSIWMPVILSGLGIVFNIPLYAIIGFFIGYVSHLFADGLTVRGVRPLYPINLKIRGFVKTGGALESVLFVLLVTYFLTR
jgi:inner membrane protein